MLTNAFTWDPFRDVEAMLATAERAWSTAGATPGVNVYANDESAVITTELPGVPAEAVQVQFDDGSLTITAERPATSEDGETLVRERPALRFSRSVSLPFAVDPSRIEARLRDGVLTVALSRPASDRPRRIQVSTN